MEAQVNKPFIPQKTGKKLLEKKKKDGPNQNVKNPKAVSFNSAIRARRQAKIHADRAHRREFTQVTNRSEVSISAPIIVAVVGPSGVGKSTLIQNLVKHHSKQKLNLTKGPITVVSGKKKRFTFIECPVDITAMVDVAKVADLVLLLIDANFGFEMETFEFLNIAQSHGLPKVIGVLTHLDLIQNQKNVRKTKNELKKRFWKELFPGAKLFYFSRFQKQKYPINEVKNLSRFISNSKIRPLSWKNTHPFILADRYEDITNASNIKNKKSANGYKKLSFYGFVRGTNLIENSKIYLVGVGSFKICSLKKVDDPCPLPDQEKRRVSDSDRKIYAPMAEVGDIICDEDAVYIEIKDHKVNLGEKIIKNENSVVKKNMNENKIKEMSEGQKIIKSLQDLKTGIDKNTRSEKFCISGNSKLVTEEEVLKYENINENKEITKTQNTDVFNRMVVKNVEENGRVRRRVIFTGENEKDSNNDSKGLENIEKTKIKIKMENQSLFDEIYGKNIPKKEELNSKKENKKIKDIENPRKTEKKTPTKEVHPFRVLEEVDESLAKIIKSKSLRKKFVPAEKDKIESEEETLMNENHVDDVKEEKQKLLSSKERKKIRFDRLYDEAKDRENMDEKRKKSGEMEKIEGKLNSNAAAKEEEEYVGLAESEKATYRGHPPGTYVRIVLEGVPPGFCKNFDAAFPVVLGGCKSKEENMSFIQARIKKHRWHKRALKSGDPLIFSAGWRRFQSIPVFSVEDSNGRQRMLKCAPEHSQCFATFWAPVLPQGTGFCAFSSLNLEMNSFQIVATGIIKQTQSLPKIVKKLRLVGEPAMIERNTAFIKGMFHTSQEAAKFEGAAIRTVSGIRGSIKKTLPNKEPGMFRATFEDKILFSDLVFLRCWVPVPLEKFYNPLMLRLFPSGNSEGTRRHVMKTKGELRSLTGIKNEFKKDSVYKNVERVEKIFAPFKVPKKLQKELPFSSKPKEAHKRQNKSFEQKRPKIISMQKRTTAKILNYLGKIKNDSLAKRKAKSLENMKSKKLKLEKEESARLEKEKEKRKLRYRKNKK